MRYVPCWNHALRTTMSCVVSTPCQTIISVSRAAMCRCVLCAPFSSTGATRLSSHETIALAIASKTMLTVLLDLDHTLIESVSTGKLKTANVQRGPGNVPTHGASAVRLANDIARFEWHLIPGYVVCLRPHARAFIALLFAAGYRVGVWTAASAGYARDILALLHLDRMPLSYFMYDVHDQTGGKPLHTLFESNDMVVIVDDNDAVKATQPHRCVQVPPFYVSTPEHDTALMDAASVIINDFQPSQLQQQYK
ncbi:NIF NLI interacting factor [Infectious spleen and kidney necrosis virus]|uniref:ORF005L n=5 Tax=Infectious spleen and kidney necrosis virus TaxID=180170 RepID=Q8QUV4_ISKNN|nr:ORF005L [Infectious spleen and kidney necrosis virus]QIQ54450.1 catalytic domain of ctd-like phosphatase [Angelfish iridovirus AFIV-16]QOE77145.1 NIF/NLI-interacting factor [Banggai cardinalfish iridovirus]QYK20537.1 NLI interacting factor-like phosphatase [Spotted knifejaw iridovirus]AAL98729.1 ORF005L [Infectious spleen and kidney necrosis virus]AMM04417.1 ORF007L [Infectious spleen and kidney necrosis virus]